MPPWGLASFTSLIHRAPRPCGQVGALAMWVHAGWWPAGWLGGWHERHWIGRRGQVTYSHQCWPQYSHYGTVKMWQAPGALCYSNRGAGQGSTSLPLLSHSAVLRDLIGSGLVHYQYVTNQTKELGLEQPTGGRGYNWWVTTQLAGQPPGTVCSCWALCTVACTCHALRCLPARPRAFLPACPPACPPSRLPLVHVNQEPHFSTCWVLQAGANIFTLLEALWWSPQMDG